MKKENVKILVLLNCKDGDVWTIGKLIFDILFANNIFYKRSIDFISDEKILNVYISDNVIVRANVHTANITIKYRSKTYQIKLESNTLYDDIHDTDCHYILYARNKNNADLEEYAYDTYCRINKFIKKYSI